ncbi:MAG: GAF domain-containing protein [Anaerolineales bacterium]
MAEHHNKLLQEDEKLSQNLLQNIMAINDYTQEVEGMLTQTLQVLSKVGNVPPFDMASLQLRGQQQRATLQKSAQELVLELDELKQLVRTSALITTSLEIDHVLNEVVDTVIQLTGAERAYLMLVKGEDDLSVRAARNNQGVSISEDDITFSHGVIKAAITEGDPIVTTNAQEDERFSQMHSVMRNDLRSILVIPMMLQGVAIGVLYLDNRLTSAAFHRKSIPVLTAFANQAAIAIENARLFERVQSSLQRTQREVKRLRIALDENKLQSQVSEITGSDYFVELSKMAKDLRNKKEDDAG